MANWYVDYMGSYCIVRFWQYVQGKKCADIGSYITECDVESYSYCRLLKLLFENQSSQLEWINPITDPDSIMN